MNRIIFLVILLYCNCAFSQSISLKVSDNLQYIYITVKSESIISIKKDIEYANNNFYQVKTIGVSPNKLTVFLYDEKGNFIESGIANKTIGKADFESAEQLDSYWKEKEILNKAYQDIRQIKMKIPTSKNIILKYPFRIYSDATSLFKEYPCTMLNCWYEFYTLEKGRKYKMQIQLKVKSKIYRSNIVEFIY